MPICEFQLIYSVLEEPVKTFWIPYLGLFIGGFFLYLYIRDRKRERQDVKMIGLLLLIFNGIALVAVPTWNYFEHKKIQNRFNSEELKMVEGYLKDSDPMPFEGHRREFFTIGRIRFNYTDYNDMHRGFRNTKSHGGPIDSNQYLRIGYVVEDGENIIWKIEIRK